MDRHEHPRAGIPAFTHGDWVQVYIDPDDDPDPQRRGPGFIRIEERQGAPGVAVLPIAEQHIGLVSVYRRTVDAVCVEIPRGFGGEGTGPRSDAVRELHEETGLETVETELVDLGTLHPNSGLLAGVVALFAASFPAITSTTVHDTREIMGFQWVPVAEVVQQMVDGELKDGFTHAAVLRAAGKGLLELFPGRRPG